MSILTFFGATFSDCHTLFGATFRCKDTLFGATFARNMGKFFDCGFIYNGTSAFAKNMILVTHFMNIQNVLQLIDY